MGSYSPAWVITEQSTNDVWISSSDLWDWLKGFNDYDTTIIQNKALLREQYANLDKKAPFGPTTRFPLERFYFCAVDPAFTAYLDKILSYLGSKDRRGEVLSTQGVGSSESNPVFRATADATRAFQLARNTLLGLLSKQDTNARAAAGLYCTPTFEKKFNLLWTPAELNVDRAPAFDQGKAAADLIHLPPDRRPKYISDIEGEIAELKALVIESIRNRPGVNNAPVPAPSSATASADKSGKPTSQV